MVASRHGLPSWMRSTAASRVDFEGNVDTIFREQQQQQQKKEKQQSQSVPIPDANLSFGERALSAAGAAFVSAILVNPLDVAKVGFCKFISFLASYSFWDYLGDAHLFICSSFVLNFLVSLCYDGVLYSS